MTTEIDPAFHWAWPVRGAMATIVIATRQEIAGAGIEAILKAGHSVVARCSCVDHLLRSLEACRPDIMILAEDIVRQQQDREAVLRLWARNCSVRIILLAERRDAITTTNLMDFHVEGIVWSGSYAKTLIECVASVHQGRKWIDPELLRQLALAERPDARDLTSREADIARHVSQGFSNKEIARELHMSEGTVKMHLHHIYGKLHLGGRTQLVVWMAGEQARMAASGRVAVEVAGPEATAAAMVFAGHQSKNLA
jgi:two-component system nitrate/nitrite response regulator NarL